MSGLQDAAPRTLREFLTEIGAFDTPHSGRTLALHLIGTGALLKLAGLRDSVWLAGALHSVYGTNAFRRQTVSPADRLHVRNLFGEDTERLVWLFATLNRPRGIETGYTLDWQTGERIPVTSWDLMALRLIEAANLIDQNIPLERWPNIAEAWAHCCTLGTPGASEPVH